ncbi:MULTISPECIES: hypothetical protein [Butyricimonas]|uniref:hypothetical protein n=1 Tax=Butyricimonas TaxID=574697 RepID=UPI0007FB42D3|nr:MULTISPECIES: hypothetical protein [Butyricimonas]
MTDHLGSTRVVLEASGNTLVPIQTTEYYPFGLAFANNNLDKNKMYEAEGYWGKTTSSGDIFYGDYAFDNYAILKETYMKESYHANRIKKGLPIPAVPDGVPSKYLEEINGYLYAYKNRGLYGRGSKNIPWQGINHYKFQLELFDVKTPNYPKSFIYKISRRW